MSGKDIVDKVENFFYEDEDFSNLFEKFANKHAHRIDLKSEEMKLEYTDIYNEFQKLFEKTLSGTYACQAGCTLWRCTLSRLRLPCAVPSTPPSPPLPLRPLLLTPLLLPAARFPDFISDHGSTVREFYGLLKDAFDEDEEGERAIFAQIMMATTDFDVFMQLMRDTAEELPSPRRDEGKDGGGEDGTDPNGNTDGKTADTDSKK
jgi:hypothetical protein